jgi:hypothetical protein
MERTLPATVAQETGGVELQMKGIIQQPGHILRPFDIAANPVKVFSNAA